MKKNILLYGTTNYGSKLTSSDTLKFKELSQKFNVFVMTYNKTEKFIDHDYVGIQYLRKPRYLFLQYTKFYFLNIFKVKKFCEKNEVNIISAKDPISALIPILIKLFFTKDLKIVIEHHGDFLKLLLNQRSFKFNFLIVYFSKVISNFTYKNCDLIRGVEKNYTDSLAKKYNKSYVCFPAWVDYKNYKIRNLQRKNLVFVGNIIPRKGVLFLIKAFERYIKENNFKEKLLIIGNDQNFKYYKKCELYVKKNNIKNIEFLGKKTPEQLAKIYSSSRLVLMASNFEGLPRVLIESGLCATPSLASNIQGISDPFGRYGGTILYELNNMEDFQEKLTDIIANEQLQTNLQQKSIKLSLELSGKNVFLNNWIELVEKLYEK